MLGDVLEVLQVVPTADDERRDGDVRQVDLPRHVLRGRVLAVRGELHVERSPLHAADQVAGPGRGLRAQPGA